MRSRIVTIAVIAATVALVLFGLPLAVAVAQYAEAYKSLDLERQADRAALRVAATLSDDGVPAADELEDDATLTYLSVYDHDGIYIRGRGPDRPDVYVLAATQGTPSTGSADGELIVAVPVTHDGEVVGVVRVSGSRDALLWPVGLAWFGMLGLALVAIGIVWLLARRQAVRLARPLDDLSTAARRLGNGDFSVRVPAVEYIEIDAVGSALNRTAVRLDDLLARERAFSADASHQLRTPLTTLRLGLEAALVRPGHDLRSAIHKGLDSAERIERTVDELLTLARDTHGPVDVLDIALFLREATEPWVARLGDEGRALRVSVDPQTPPAVASAAAVRQVLAVLLDNALTHGAGPVEVSARDAGDAVGIEVADGGPGITADAANQLFSRRSAAANGHGVGLALARRLAEAEGGHLRLASTAPPVFTLLLPAERAR
ncbi:HAMP domain-containing histidine kinase [Pseudonocardia sp. KRD-182]|nr:HAMP domain-containing histidine kinase [Pseudonocardia oceani]